ncbi:MAG: SusC/RagA family TonB-linked outer membrane protein [Gemmatimonadota bacterium]|nr:SusC/RagA family TonB-linked outer membrane protein [Gemmatimonadota bacterium]MXX35711.1 SusC/RagA family TonB-linked outer membrane protein [Gemmatimonadota bacterium]MYD15342.1 SusC/RagA family TonB-linked outer membrane protein [Gemmatimonadota bacterium]
MTLLRKTVVALALLALAAPANAQDRATVTGVVTDAGTMGPLAGAQVQIEGTNFGQLANAEGRFVIANIPPGTHTLRAVYIGFGPVAHEFTVAAGETAEVNFELSTSALALDGIVVTATGQQRKRELGNAVGDIDAAGIREVAPINNLSDLLQGRSAGVQILNSAGTSGVGSRIRIRGSSSISLSNEPLVYVDGIRVDNRMSGLGAGGQESSRLDDFNPEDIESIEIVKGPSAATLYGTEAANGVIRITTRRGLPGATRWNVWTEGGIIEEPNTYPLNFAGLDAGSERYGRSCRLNEVAQGLCNQTSIESYQVLHDPDLTPIDDGNRTQYGLSVTGGSERINYYIAGELETEVGPYSLPDPDREDLEARGVPITSEVERPNQLRRKNLRVNLNSQVADRVTLALQMSYLDSHFAYMGNDNNSFGFLPSAFFGGSNPDRAWGFQRPAQLFGRTFYQDTNRMTAGGTVTWDPMEWLEVRGTAGVDYYNRGDVSFFARDIGVPGDSNRGRKDTDYINQWQYTFDASSTASFDLTESITSRSTVGVQYFENQFKGTTAWGIDIVNGGSSIGLAAETFSSEFHTFEKTAGLFIDQQFGLNDRLFVTGAIRADDNSAFGQDFDLIYYPKAGLSWIASEEEFFPEIPFVDQLRFRGAWGKSGLQPGSDDAIRTLAATAITTPADETGSGVSIGSIGNSLLEPERSSEIEVGFDAEIAGGRAGLEFTYYDKRTDGALITVPLAPSLGASASRWVNIGEVQNKGYEATLTAGLVEVTDFSWDITLSGSINQNELLSLGEGTEPIGSQTRFVPGFPLGGQWDRPILGWNDGDGNSILTPDELMIGDTIEYIGPGQPENQLTIISNFRILESVNVYGMLDYRGNYVAYNNTERFRCRFRLCQALIDPATPIDEQARAVASLLHPSQTVWGYMEKGDFWKLREVSVRYDLPEFITSQIGASRGSLTLSGRNLGTWTDYTGMDPEINWNGSGDNFGVSEFLTQPPVRYYTARVNFTF